MITMQSRRFLKGVGNYRVSLAAVAVCAGAFSLGAAYRTPREIPPIRFMFPLRGVIHPPTIHGRQRRTILRTRLMR